MKQGYAILSHVWRHKGKPEQSFADMKKLCHSPRDVSPYDDERVDEKVRGCALAAKKLGYGWVWDDTCCIDNQSSAELEEAINSMYRWYAEAAVCLVYLADVPDDCFIEEPDSAFRNSDWFKRGWTLQELLAPHCLIFLSCDWQHLGTKFGLADLLEEITGIDAEVLTFRRALHHVSVARRLSWASKRKTTKIEDQAYSLLGIFGVSMATIYGEGSYAFRRLQYKILKSSADHTLFAWGDMWLPTDEASESTLAQNPTSKQDRRNPSSTPSKPHHFARPPRVEQCDSLFAPSPAEFRQAHTPDVISITLEGVLAWARSVFDLGDPSVRTVSLIHLARRLIRTRRLESLNIVWPVQGPAASSSSFLDIRSRSHCSHARTPNPTNSSLCLCGQSRRRKAKAQVPINSSGLVRPSHRRIPLSVLG